jgi:hypothetical protein
MVISSELAAEWGARLSQLQTWPEKLIIYDLTSFLEEHVEVASDLMPILLDRITDASSCASFQISLLYLLDSVMKNLNINTYNDLISSSIVHVCEKVFSKVTYELTYISFQYCYYYYLNPNKLLLENHTIHI